MTDSTSCIHYWLHSSKRFVRKLNRLMRRRWLLRFGNTRSLASEVEFRVHWVDPFRIEYVSQLCTYADLDRNRVVSGDWDRLCEKFDASDFYEAYRQVLVEGMDWRETAFYRRVLAQMSTGAMKWGCRTPEEFDRRLDYVTRLYGEMAELGYVPNHNIQQICVDVGRDGDLMFVDGQHRLSFARLLRFSCVPVMLVVRHRAWMEFRRQIVKYALRHGGRVRDPLIHPDLEDIESEYGAKRFELIRRSTHVQSGRLLDLGSHWGYFCHRFEELGFECTAVEPDEDNHYFLTKIRRAQHKQFAIHCQDPFAYLTHSREAGETNDVVLALGVFENPVSSEKGREDFEHLFSLVDTLELYVMPRPGANGIAEDFPGPWVFLEEEFMEFVLAHSQFTDVSCLGHIEDGSPVYRLAGPRTQ